MIRRIAIPLILAVLLAPAPTALALDGGVPDGNAHPNVGLLGFDVDGAGPTPPFSICTGSVISDHAFLTAAHCIETPLVPAGVAWAVTLEGGSPSAPILPGGVFPDEYPTCCTFTLPQSSIAYATDVVVDPQFDPDGFTSPTAGAHDLAVLEFAPGTFAGVTPVTIVAPELLDLVRAAGNRRGPQVTLVGYGAETRGDQLYVVGTGSGVARRSSRTYVAEGWLVLTQSTDALPRSAAPCAGDSGSPQFLGGSNIQVSVYHTASACQGIGYAQRLDTPSEQAGWAVRSMPAVRATTSSVSSTDMPFPSAIRFRSS